MMKVSCEDFEREFTTSVDGGIDSERKRALEEHRRTCPSCKSFDENTHAIRNRLLRVPKLETPPYFAANLRREINRMEQGLKRPDWNTGLVPRFLSLGTGFALALICGILIFRPGTQQTVYPPLSVPVAENKNTTQDHNPGINEDHSLASDPTELWLVTKDAGLDTATHRLPEPAGQDSIPIPVDDDYWRLNQVSTTPNDP